MNKSYAELKTLPTLEERFNYLKLHGTVGEETFGFERYLNQTFYRSREWKQARNRIIIRDEGCDMGLEDYPINGPIFIHHINPIMPEIMGTDSETLIRILTDPNNLICVSRQTHQAIHYGDSSLLPKDYKERRPGDTTLW